MEYCWGIILCFIFLEGEDVFWVYFMLVIILDDVYSLGGS